MGSGDVLRRTVFSADSIEFLLAVIGILDLCDGDTNRSIVESASFGRDCDTIASVVGNITGALHGTDSIRNDWIEKCEAANSEFFEEVLGTNDVDFKRVSEWMVNALENERRRTKQRVEILDTIF